MVFCRINSQSSVKILSAAADQALILIIFMSWMRVVNFVYNYPWFFFVWFHRRLTTEGFFFNSFHFFLRDSGKIPNIYL